MTEKNARPAQLDELPAMLTACDLARLMQTTTRTIRRLVIRGELPKPQRLGRLAVGRAKASA